MLRNCIKYIFILFFLIFIGCKEDKYETLRVCFTGDLLLDRGVRQRIERLGIDTIFSNVSSIIS